MTTTPSGAARLGTLASAGLFVLRRLSTALLALFGVTLIVFILSRGVGDPVYLLVGQTGTQEQMDQLREQYGFNRPLIVQFGEYLLNLVQGDLGQSTFSRRPVTEELATYFPATLELALAALIVGVILTVPLGIAAALRPKSLWDRIATGFVRFGVAMPSFWLGLLFVLIFVYVLKVAPPPTGELDIGVLPPPQITGMTVVDAALTGNQKALSSSLAHLVLPTLTLALTSFPALLSLTYAVSTRVFASDYMRTAKATGLAAPTVYGNYALKNIAPPVITQIAMTFGYLLGGTVLVETVFSWPGIGQYSVMSMQRLDYEPVLGVAVLASAVYLTLYFVADIISLIIDPRIRHER
jgi:peptide/nickel transport system permease protein